MNPQNRLYDLFLQDTFKIAEKEEWDAIEFISRLRLYMTVTGYEGTCGISFQNTVLPEKNTTCSCENTTVSSKATPE